VIARRFLVSGLVQGVGFRFFTVRAARQRGLLGWVRNLPDGRVEVLAAGEEENLSAFREDLRRGPGGASVSEVDETAAEAAAGRLEEFNVRF
jgi:acylphosphatase